MCTISGNALEKAGGREFLEGIKELRKAQAPLEVASGRDSCLHASCDNTHMQYLAKKNK